jgi:hypothetical protein
MKTITSFEAPVQRSPRRLHIPVSIITALAGLGGVVAFWAPVYLGMLDHVGGGLSAWTEALGWLLFAVGAFGLGSVVYLAWQDTRDPAWRAAHGLPRRAQSNPAGH